MFIVEGLAQQQQVAANENSHETVPKRVVRCGGDNLPEEGVLVAGMRQFVRHLEAHSWERHNCWHALSDETFAASARRTWNEMWTREQENTCEKQETDNAEDQSGHDDNNSTSSNSHANKSMLAMDLTTDSRLSCPMQPEHMTGK